MTDEDNEPPVRTFPKGAVTDKTVIMHLFAEAPNINFIDSLKEWWDDKKFLTEKQFAALERMVYPEGDGPTASNVDVRNESKLDDPPLTQDEAERERERQRQLDLDEEIPF